jgi:hypothetical protein
MPLFDDLLEIDFDSWAERDDPLLRPAALAGRLAADLRASGELCSILAEVGAQRRLLENLRWIGLDKRVRVAARAAYVGQAGRPVRRATILALLEVAAFRSLEALRQRELLRRLGEEPDADADSGANDSAEAWALFVAVHGTADEDAVRGLFGAHFVLIDRLIGAWKAA